MIPHDNEHTFSEMTPTTPPICSASLNDLFIIPFIYVLVNITNGKKSKNKYVNDNPYKNN